MKRKRMPSIRYALLTYAGISSLCLILCFVPQLRIETVFHCWSLFTLFFYTGLAFFLLVSITQKGAPCHKRRNPRRRSIQDWRD